MKQTQAFPALPLPFIAPFIGFGLPIANQQNLREPTGREGHGHEEIRDPKPNIGGFPNFSDSSRLSNPRGVVVDSFRRS